MKVTLFTFGACIALAAASASAADKEITLEQIMGDPDWMGRSANNWYWGDDSESIFYQQKRAASKLSDLFVQNLDSSNPSKIPMEQLQAFSDQDAVVNADANHKAYIYEDNVFLKELASGKVTQVSHSSAKEYQLAFLLDGRLSYRSGSAFMAYDPSTKLSSEIANLLTEDDPADEEISYLAQEQRKLIDFIDQKIKDRDAAKAEKKELAKQNVSVAPGPLYFGKDNEIKNASLSPAGDKIIVAVTKRLEKDEKDIMATFISESGNIEPTPVRRRVADQEPVSHTVYLVDLNDHSKTELKYDTLPDFDKDVLKSVRQENHKREDKKYKSEKKPRDIIVMSVNNVEGGTSDPIQWNDDGSQVAIMLEAWDNKDRWLASVDFEDNKLISEHQLHDDAWVSYAHNEFLWAHNGETLYILSEESGYSHIYSKELGKRARQLTQGQFVVNNLVLSRNDDRLYYRANKDHPGNYEIYQLNLQTGEDRAVTDLNGVVASFHLSPDENSLLMEHSSATRPPELYVAPVTGDEAAKQITHTISDTFKSYDWIVPEIITYPTEGTDAPVYARLFRPEGDNGGEKRKAVVFIHGAGYMQNVHMGWSGYYHEYMFHNMLLQKGYVVLDLDFRASKGYGRDWRTAIYRQMGTPEVIDIKAGVNWLVENENVDAGRIGTYGGSYGGFLTLMSMFNEPDMFAAGSALRLVSDWAYYNHDYTSNILNTPADDPIAYERSSPIYFAEGLSKPLLINAPMVDNNVFFEDGVRLVQRLIELEKQNFETAIYPVEPHGFRQPSSWLNEYRRIFKLFEDEL